ncbi:hypothetical protein, partial [Pseudomonas syringae group genomosp. 7]|uniref:hypothetical protein n=1 Tax=Pseudomonas syringae group genomosp. 7 TaxID=251699 RepID=UPI0037704882
LQKRVDTRSTVFLPEFIDKWRESCEIHKFISMPTTSDGSSRVCAHFSAMSCICRWLFAA